MVLTGDLLRKAGVEEAHGTDLALAHALDRLQRPWLVMQTIRDHQLGSALLACGDDLLALGYTHGHRLLQQQMNSRLERLHREFQVIEVRRRQVGRVNLS